MSLIDDCPFSTAPDGWLTFVIKLRVDLSSGVESKSVFPRNSVTLTYLYISESLERGEGGHTCAVIGSGIASNEFY